MMMYMKSSLQHLLDFLTLLMEVTVLTLRLSASMQGGLHHSVIPTDRRVLQANSISGVKQWMARLSTRNPAVLIHYLQCIHTRTTPIGSLLVIGTMLLPTTTAAPLAQSQRTSVLTHSWKEWIPVIPIQVKHTAHHFPESAFNT
jgi:hypothetical protein